ncbi:uncharacterized protein LOC111596682 isoform X2 [Drosophila hydei]|uniref:Uncharacterized protein LOC111596682 isoform X2 n=1 Tax=Drosophila hydei TaxID=7224 RepID=A0A6J1LJU5_DROHY|nr:uncharacterized protein LOC111596682 isoform X2 [Drosophila hydei]
MIADDNSVKFFDRKFVAVHLRSQLHCPKCTREYSHKFTEGAGASDNHRPFLLPCGHHMCEFCISKHCQQADFKCAVCFSSALPSFIAKELNGKSIGNISDYYELNYHVLGETNSLDYGNRYSLEESLLCLPTLSEIVLETKCSECGHRVASGECKQCNAFYCKRCFETVHHYSRVLKTHIFQTLDDKQRTGSDVDLRIGNDIFRMPVQLMCNVHNVPATIFCTSCRRNSCEACAIRHHANHVTYTVSEMNHRYVTEIPSSISSIDAALMQIKNAQLVVQNTKKKLGDFATETLTNISQRFRLLHGQLQSAEQKTIEMLREASLPPQLQLNQAISQLNDYETVLKNLRQLLNCGTDGRYEVPQNIWLKDIIMIISEHLENIPSYVQVTNLDRNPYHLQTTNNLSEMIGRHLNCQFRNPKIEVRFNNEYDQLSRISIRSQPKESKSIGSLAHGRLGKKLKRRPKKSKSSSSSMKDSASERNVQQMNFLRTFSAMDISKSNSARSMSNKLSSHLGDRFRTDAIVRVRSIQSPEDFYVQCIHAAQRMRDSLEAFAETPACLPPNLIVVGQQYITFNNQNETDRWHRALVIRKADSREIYDVFLPDVGLTRKVHSSNFRQMPEHLATLPYTAVHCSLKQLMPSNGGTEWEPQAIDFLKQVVQNNPVYITILRALGAQLYEVDLSINNYDSTISVREAFLYTGLALERNVFATPLTSKSQQLMAEESQRLPKYVPRVGDVLIIQMLHVEQPLEFYVMPHELEHNRSSLQRSLQSFMDHLSLSQLEPIFLGRLELGCAVQSEGQWHRACIEIILPKGYVLVRLVDTGITQKVYWDQLFMLPRIFWTQEIAIKCCLADVETLQVNNYTWTPAAIDAFKQLTSNPKLQMEVVSVRNNVAYVVLHFGNSNVAAAMVSQGHCESSGASSKVVKPQPARLSQLDADARRLINEAKEEEHLDAHPPSGQTDTMNRSPIEVLHVQHPGEFYVTLAHFVSAIAELRKTVQATAAEMYQSCSPTTSWQPGDMCYVRVKAKGDQDMLWHRGQIVACADFNTASKYDVRLRDIGELVPGVPNNCLTAMDEALVRISNSAMCCRLFDIVPNGIEWSAEAVGFFKSQLTAYSSLHVTGYGRSGDCLNVILWGANTEISGPFSPARIKYTNINEVLLRAGHAIRDPLKLLKQENESTTSSDSSSSSLCSQQSGDMDLFAGIDMVARIERSQEAPKLNFQHTYEMPPLELLNDLNTKETTFGCNEPPVAWLQPRTCKKSVFTALPTYVNNQCEIYLSLATDEPFIHHMRNLLVNHFKPLLEQQRQSSSYVVGQPVVVTYHLDNLIYRGIVKSKLSAQGKHNVYYVDYGNEEKVSPVEMLPYAPFPQLNSLCWRIAIHGIQPKQKNYSVKTVDAVHQTVVMKLSSVRVMEAKGVDGISQCQIKVGDMDIGTMMLNNEMAIRAATQGDEELKQQRAKTLKSFKVFEELLQLGDTQPPLVLEQVNTTAQPPPAKKKYMLDSKELLHTECEKDFDCKEPVKQEQLQTSIKLEKDSDEDHSEENNSAEGFSDGYVIEEIVESNVNKEDEKTSSAGPEQASFMPPQNISAVEQLRRRIQLRHKERLDSAHFSPMDTSTERSYQRCFKAQCLPTGVKHFSCSIDKVVSATELQISPQLTEFTKQEIVLAQETSALILDAAQLNPVEMESLCLARYSLDNQWYRAVIKEVFHASNQATVYYMDFHDTEVVPFIDLKVMPKQLFMFPQRSFRVNLYGIKINRNFADTSVRQALQACLCKYPLVYARVHYPHDYHDNSEDYGESEPCSSSDSIRQSFKLLEVDIYENKFKTELLYKPLIDSRMFLLK